MAEKQLGLNAQTVTDDHFGELLAALGDIQTEMKSPEIVAAHQRWGTLRKDVKEAKQEILDYVASKWDPLTDGEKRQYVVNETWEWTGRSIVHEPRTTQRRVQHTMQLKLLE